MIFEKAFWFIKKGYMLQMSYKFDFFLRLFFMLFNILTYYFIAKLIGEGAARYLEPYGGGLLLLRSHRDGLLRISDDLAPELFRERARRADDGDPGGHAGDPHQHIEHHRPVISLELHLRLIPGAALSDHRHLPGSGYDTSQCWRGDIDPDPHHNMLQQHRNIIGQLHHGLQERRPDQHAPDGHF